MWQELNKNVGKIPYRRSGAAFIYLEVEKRGVLSRALPCGLSRLLGKASAHPRHNFKPNQHCRWRLRLPSPALTVQLLPCRDSTHSYAAFGSDSNSFSGVGEDLIMSRELDPLFAFSNRLWSKNYLFFLSFSHQNPYFPHGDEPKQSYKGSKQTDFSSSKNVNDLL